MKGGFAYKGEYLGSGEVKLLGMGVVSHSERFLKNGMRSYGGEFSESFRANSGDIVIATRQQSDNLPILGCPALVPSDLTDTDIVVGTNLYKVTNQSDVDNKFLYWLLRGNEYRNRILECSKGTTVRMITKDAVENFTFPCPPLPVRREISHFLDALDDRITLLRETNATLEAIAQALFKSWFVDFDPVRAKMEGRTPEGMDEATAALFPDGFETSELGEVPRGWRVAKFENFVERLPVGKKFDQKTAKAEGVVPILDQGKSGVIGFHHEDPGVRASLDEPVVVFANHTCYMRLITYDFSAIQNVLPFKGKGIDTVWAYYATKGRVKFSEYKGHWPDFTIEKAVVPSMCLGEAFRSVVDPLMRRVRLNEVQSDSLARLRDTLLPRLISGQLRLPESQNEITQAIA